MKWVIQSWVSRDRTKPGYVRIDVDNLDDAAKTALDAIRSGNAIVQVDKMEV